MQNKVVVILGPTASGKTDLSIKLAKKFRGEIISADSRQVYKGLNIGSGKVTKKAMQGIPHYLLDVANPKRKFTVAQYQKLALRTIKDIQKRDKLPFLVGGTGFYIQAVVDGLVIPEVKPNWKLRKKLESKGATQLFSMLRRLDPVRAKTIDAKNSRRVIRAIEIVMATKQPVPKLQTKTQFDTLQLGIKKSSAELKKAINERLLKRMKRMTVEVKKLRRQGLSWNRLEEFGLEYRFVAQFLQGKLTKQEMIDQLQKAIEHFAKRQITWFKRDKQIHWLGTEKQAERFIKEFLN